MNMMLAVRRVLRSRSCPFSALLATAAGAAITLSPGAALGQAANDNCADAIIAVANTSYSGSQVNCNTDGLCVCSNGGKKDVWYSFIPAVTGTYRISTCGSGGDTILSLHSGCPGNTTNQLPGNSCNDDQGPGCVSTNASLEYVLTAGVTYKVRVASYYEAFLPNYNFIITPRFTLGACGVNVGGQTVCQLRSAGDCASAGGTYNGDNSPCNTLYASPATTYTDAANAAIPDNAWVERTINVSGFTGTLGHLRVNARIDHPFVTDLIMELTHQPSGVRSLIWQRACAINNAIPTSGLSVSVEDGVSDTFVCPTTLVPLAAGQRPPVDILAAFNGRDPNGAWTLRVTDVAASDVGTLLNWSLELSRRTQDVFGVDNGGGNPCPADFNDSGTIDAVDLFAFLDAWFAQTGQSGSGLSADFDASNTVDAVDLFDYLDEWFANTGTSC